MILPRTPDESLVVDVTRGLNSGSMIEQVQCNDLSWMKQNHQAPTAQLTSSPLHPQCGRPRLARSLLLSCTKGDNRKPSSPAAYHVMVGDSAIRKDLSDFHMYCNCLFRIHQWWDTCNINNTGVIERQSCPLFTAKRQNGKKALVPPTPEISLPIQFTKLLSRAIQASTAECAGRTPRSHREQESRAVGRLSKPRGIDKLTTLKTACLPHKALYAAKQIL